MKIDIKIDKSQLDNKLGKLFEDVISKAFENTVNETIKNNGVPIQDRYTPLKRPPGTGPTPIVKLAGYFKATTAIHNKSIVSILTSSKNYAIYHQTGTKKMVARPYVDWNVQGYKELFFKNLKNEVKNKS
jgi:phage gpG-like protein